MKIIRYFAVTSLALMMWACSPEQKAPAESFVGGEWTLVELNGREIPAGTKAPTLRADEGQTFIFGFSGVNTYRGGYKLDGDRIDFLQMASTLMAGPEPAMKLEQEYSQMMGQVNSWRIKNGKLELLKDSEVLARFTR